jgi:hypothetical protein
MRLDHLDLPHRARDVARVLQDYDHELFLERLPPSHPYIIEQPDKPFAVIHRPVGAPEYIVRVYPESMLDERVIADVIRADAAKSGFDLDKFDALSAANQVLHERKRSDEIAEQMDRLEWEQNKKRWE